MTPRLPPRYTQGLGKVSIAPDTLLIIDDHALFRAGVVAMLATAFAGAVVLGYASLDEALASAAVAPAIVLLDIQLPGRGGLEGIGLILQRWPAACSVVVSGHDRPDTVAAALRRGAAAFLSKTGRSERMIAVVRAMLDESPLAPLGCGAARPLLTERQREVLDLAGQGLSNRLIGHHLGLSEHTARGHMQALLAAPGVARRTQAIFKARQLGLIG